jgi:2-polyprenyl-3-methyl-5-hydroxy-6-metoxy-1,4-benzoquinol methylase
MTAVIEQLDYETKAGDYFAEARAEMLPFVPANCHRLLDVGCGVGGFGASLKETRQIEIWGVELVSSVAAKATTKLDRVITGLFEPETKLPSGAFDCIVFNDVLEHMIAPEQATFGTYQSFGSSGSREDGSTGIAAYWTRRIFASLPSRAF